MLSFVDLLLLHPTCCRKKQGGADADGWTQCAMALLFSKLFAYEVYVVHLLECQVGLEVKLADLEDVSLTTRAYFDCHTRRAPYKN